ncbi:right-handed parallel beta-helix repeat-containing protein [Halomontanus rarus]|uniref:right-handed parallel beta-helix repeat-containing protein n=1 Tax=Halomontanus rarus TaxID=3034020 RepID=UPI0023E7D0DD|nr:right-handed parallel beta-helix repeat-containing protein [Halovivax sp. TS33]
MSNHEEYRNDADCGHEDTRDQVQVRSSEETDTSRRRFVKGVTLTGLAAIGLSSHAAASHAYTEYDDEYRTVVNVAEAGADTTGQKSITPVLESLRADNTLLYFPPGQYAMDSQFRFTGFERFGVVGNDATLVPADYHDFDGPRYRLFRLGTQNNPGKHLRFEGFTVDQTAPDTGIRAIEAWASDRLEVRDVHVRGQHDSGTWGPGLFNVVDPDGTGLVENFRAPDGGAWVENTPNAGNNWRGPIGIEANHTEGTLTFRRCMLGAFPSNGLYACGGSGQIIVHGGLYRNSNPVNLRIGGTDSIIRWPTVEIDETRTQDGSQRGIRLESGSVRVKGAAVRISSPMPTSHGITVMNSCTSARIEDTKIEISGDRINHGIVVSPSAAETVISNTEIQHATSGGYPLWIRGSDSNDRVLCEYLTVTGEAGDAAGFRDGIRCERNNCRFDVCTVDQSSRPGASRNALVNTGDDNTVYYGTYRASKYPFVEVGTDTLYMRADAESYDGDREAICLYDQSSNVALKRNRLVNGIKDYGSDGLVDWENSFQ